MARLLYVAATWPPLTAAATALVLRPGLRYGVLFSILAAAGLVWNLVYLVRTNIDVLQRLKCGYLTPFGHCRFREVDPSLLLSGSARESAAWSPPGLIVRHPRIFQVEVAPGKHTVPATLSTYPLLAHSGYIFLPPYWMADNPMHRFWLHHEIGHSSVAQFGVIYRDGLQALFLLLLAIPAALLTREALCLVTLGFFWLYWRLRAEAPSRTDVLGEIVGDVYAINHLRDSAEADEIERLYPFFVQLAGEHSTSAQQVREFRKNLARFRPVFTPSEQTRGSLGMDFITHVLTLLSFRNLLGRLSIIGVSAWIGTLLRAPDRTELIVLVIVTVLVPAIWSGFLMNWHQRLLEEVVDFLRSRGPLLEGRHKAASSG